MDTGVQVYLQIDRFAAFYIPHYFITANVLGFITNE